MTDTQTNTDTEKNALEGRRGLRVGLLTLTLVGPIVNTIVERMRQRSQSLQNTAQTTRTAARQRFNELAQTSRQFATERAQLLQEQANQLQEQAQQLRKALSENAEQSRKVAEQITADVAKRSRKVASNLTERSEGLLEPVRERGGTFWTILGFSLGLTAALVVTYVFVRQRFFRQETDQDQQIELPQDGYQGDHAIVAQEPSAQPTTAE